MTLQRRRGFYEKYMKRTMDVIGSILVLAAFWWLYIIIAAAVRIKMGKPVLFTQPRPGMVGADGRERIFIIHKFRTMTDGRDKDGNLLPDEMRLPKFGKMLRNTSLDELPEIINILKGEMSFVGPRPQLVRDMVFMSDRQRTRHTVKPGLTGLAQVNGRNAIDWEKKFEFDLVYVKKITFFGDLKIVLKTVEKMLFERGDINEEGCATATDYGDYLLNQNRVTKSEYDSRQEAALELLKEVPLS